MGGGSSKTNSIDYERYRHYTAGIIDEEARKSLNEDVRNNMSVADWESKLIRKYGERAMILIQSVVSKTKAAAERMARDYPTEYRNDHVITTFGDDWLFPVFIRYVIFREEKGIEVAIHKTVPNVLQTHLYSLLRDNQVLHTINDNMGHLTIQGDQFESKDVVINTKQQTINDKKIDDVYEFNRLVLKIAHMNDAESFPGAKRSAEVGPEVRKKIEKKEEVFDDDYIPEPKSNDPGVRGAMKVDIWGADETLVKKISAIFVKDFPDKESLEKWMRFMGKKEGQKDTSNLDILFVRKLFQQKDAKKYLDLWNKSTETYEGRQEVAKKGAETRRLNLLEKEKTDIK